MKYLLLASLLLMSGCRSGYYAQAAWGQARLLWARQPIDQALTEAKLSPRARRLLGRTPGVMRFAHERIGLVQNENYQSYVDLHGRAVSWTVLACPPDSLSPYTWTFPIVGTVPYIGFFSKQNAEAERDRLKTLGYDTALFPATAFSTLGWFADPVLSSMIALDETGFVEVLIHEQTHATVYVNGDIGFNETLANFVGHAGAVSYFEARGEAKLAQLARDRRHDERLFTRHTARLVKELTTLYDSNRSRPEKLAAKTALLERMRHRFRERVRPAMLSRRYEGFSKRILNNAIIATFALYNLELERFEQLHELHRRDWPSTFKDVLAIARASSPSEALRLRVEYLSHKPLAGPP